MRKKYGIYIILLFVFVIQFCVFLSKYSPVNAGSSSSTPATIKSWTASAGFSKKQGANQWYYQQRSVGGTTFKNMTKYDTVWRGGKGNYLSSKSFYPDKSCDAVKKWLAPYSGTIRVKGYAAKSSTGGGDGVVVSIQKNNIIIWARDIGYTDTVGYSHDLTIKVTKGDAIYFIVNKDTDSTYDKTNWDPSITYITPDSKRIKIMALGDSITFGVGSAARGGYRSKLDDLLNAAGDKIDFVGTGSFYNPKGFGNLEHEGHPSWKIQDIQRWADSWLKEYQPDAICLLIGTNNMGDNKANEYLSALVDQITNDLPNTTLFLASITPLGGQVAQYSSWVEDYNSYIPGIVSNKVSQGKKVYYVDLNKSVTTSDLVDGVHPNDAGYAKLANAWYDVIQPVISQITVNSYVKDTSITAYASDLPWISSSACDDVLITRNSYDNLNEVFPFIGGRQYLNDIILYSYRNGLKEEISVNLKNQGYTSFETDVGIDSSVTKAGSVQFVVLIDGVEKYHSKTIHGSSPCLHFKVKIPSGAKKLTLRVLDAGDGSDEDRAVWGNTTLSKR